MKTKMKKILLVSLMILSMMLLTLTPVFAVTEAEVDIDCVGHSHEIVEQASATSGACGHYVAYKATTWSYNQWYGGPCYWEIYDIYTVWYYCASCGEYLFTYSTDWYFRGDAETHEIYQSSAVLFCGYCDWWDWATPR